MYKLCYTDTFKRDLSRLDKKTRRRARVLAVKLLEDPTRFTALHGFKNYYRLRFDVYRLIYSIEGDKVILQFIKKRDEAYRLFRF